MYKKNIYVSKDNIHGYESIQKIVYNHALNCQKSKHVKCVDIFLNKNPFNFNCDLESDSIMMSELKTVIAKYHPNETIHNIKITYMSDVKLSCECLELIEETFLKYNTNYKESDINSVNFVFYNNDNDKYDFKGSDMNVDDSIIRFYTGLNEYEQRQLIIRKILNICQENYNIYDFHIYWDSDSNCQQFLVVEIMRTSLQIRYLMSKNVFKLDRFTTGYHCFDSNNKELSLDEMLEEIKDCLSGKIDHMRIKKYPVLINRTVYL